MGFLVLLVSGLLLIFLGYKILGTPFVLTLASLIPLGISMGIDEQYFTAWKKYFKWFATIGFLAIAVSAFVQIDLLRKISCRFSTVLPGWSSSWAPSSPKRLRMAKDFWWGGISGALIGIGGIALAFLSTGKPLLGIFTANLVLSCRCCSCSWSWPLPTGLCAISNTKTNRVAELHDLRISYN
jgi:hypothetical protein